MVIPAEVPRTLRRHLLVDGFDLVLDTAASRDTTLVDLRDGARFLDMFGFYASSALGMNPAVLTGDGAFRSTLAEVAVNKPSNSDVPTVHLAEFTETFTRVLGDPALPHLFLVDGGALAVENALKAAFDWKSRHNELHGRDPRLGTRVLHLTRAFHGRSGYTLSLTNTDPVKTARFPVFPWPRIAVPAVRFPLAEHRAEVETSERRALEQAAIAFDAYADDIACFIAEPIQSEGGDNHLRGEFLQALQRLCREHDALFVLDEVQTGCGATGSAWAYQQLGVEPDLVAFGKKVQVCGVMAGRRIDEVAENVFRVPGRLGSTWGGNLTDMVRARRILEVIEADGLMNRAATMGGLLLGLLDELAAAHQALVDNVRGRGLLCAFDLPARATRDAVLAQMARDERVLLLGSGERSVRFRPPLTVGEPALEVAVGALDRVLSRLPAAEPASRADGSAREQEVRA